MKQKKELHYVQCNSFLNTPIFYFLKTFINIYYTTTYKHCGVFDISKIQIQKQITTITKL